MAEATDFNETGAAHIMECPGYSTIYRSGVATSITGRPRVDVEEVVLLGSLGRPVLGNLTTLDKHLEGTHCHGRSIDVEESARCRTGVGEPESVST